MVKKRLISLLASLSVLGTLISVPQVNAAADAAQAPKFYQFDFNNQSLSATTDNGGLANSLTRADSNSDFAQEWGDGTIKFDKDLTQQQYYRLETPVTLAKNKEWLIEFRASFDVSESGNKHSAILSQAANNSKPWLWLNYDNGTFRFLSAEFNASTSIKTVITSKKMATYVIKNVPNADGNFHMFCSTDGITWFEYNDEETKLGTDDVTINYMFGPGWGAATNFKGEMDYIKLYEDLGSAKITDIAGSELNVTGGTGKLADPYTANVTLPYSLQSVSRNSIGSRAVGVTLYSDKFVTEARTVDTSLSNSQKIYLSADGAYYEINANFVVDLTKDSAVYKFDFNGNLNTSAGGLENSLITTGVDATHPIVYINDNTELNVANEIKGSDDTTTGNLNDKNNPTVIYSLEKSCTLASTKNWKISTRLRPRFRNNVLLAGNDQTDSFQIWDWYLCEYNATNKERRRISPNLSNFYQVIVMENKYDDTTGKSTLTADIKQENSSTQQYTLDLTGIDHAVKYMFSANALWGFGGYVDYMYIDTDADKTAAMEFLVKYEDVIASSTSDDVITLFNDYSALSSKAKAYMTRGEIAIIENILESSMGITSFAGQSIDVVGEGTAVSPYTANVNVPYSIAAITADMFGGIYTELNLYEDSSFAASVDEVNTTKDNSIVFYAKANNKYYQFNGTYAVDLTYDSGAYKFSFNNSSLETSASLSNKLLRADTNTDITQLWGDGTIKFENHGKDQFYSFEKTPTLAHNKAWKLEWRSLRENENKVDILFARDGNTNLSMHGHEFRINYKDGKYLGVTSSNMDSKRFVSFTLENRPDEEGNANIYALIDDKESNPITWNNRKTDNDTTDYSKTNDIIINALFGGRGVPSWNYYGEVDYFNIDLDPDKTAAMEFLARYANIIKTGIEDMPNTAVATMVMSYNNLSDTSKSYLVRGENEAMINIISSLSTTVEMTLNDSADNVVVTALGAAVEGAKLLICRYNSDGTLADVEIQDVDLVSNSNGEYSIGDYSEAYSVKAILLENFDTLKPLVDYLPIK